MTCPYCKIEITGDVGICPLCHEVLEEERGADSGFPVHDHTAKKPKRSKRVTLWYFFIVSFIFLLCFIVNISLDFGYYWSIIVGGALYYGVFLIKNTLFSYLSAGQRVFWQLIYILGFLYTVEAVLHAYIEPNSITNYGLPAVCTAATGTIFLYALFAKKYVRQNIVSVILLSSLGFLPIILYFAGVAVIFWPAMVSAAVSGAAVLFTLIFLRKYIATEFERKFHI